MPSHALTHYYAILRGDEKVKYLRTKAIMVDLDLGKDGPELWRTHDALLGANEPHGGGVSLLDLKVELGRRMLQRCALCERRCLVNRSEGESGHCGVLEPRVSSEFIHMGEEPDLVPSYTIFFSGCTFNCVYCQNWDISTRPGAGDYLDPVTVARMIEARSDSDTRAGTLRALLGRARNVNWVGGDPTSNLPFILEVLRESRANLPQVWNSNMYLTEDAMKLLDGVIDVYLTDFKYGNDKCALRLSNAKDYMRIVERNHRLARGQAEMIIRHLVLPGHIECCTRPALTWIAENLDEVVVNVMSQYRPEHRAGQFEEIARPLRMSEYNRAREIADELGLQLCD